MKYFEGLKEAGLDYMRANEVLNDLFIEWSEKDFNHAAELHLKDVEALAILSKINETVNVRMLTRKGINYLFPIGCIQRKGDSFIITKEIKNISSPKMKRFVFEKYVGSV